MKSHQLINQNSGENEWYTPSWVIDLARDVMGSIDLDPASTPKANQTVKAGQIFTLEDDGLSQNWYGNVWLNRPWGKPDFMTMPTGEKRRVSNVWIERLVSEFESGNVEQACTIHFSSTDTAWWHMMSDYPRLFFSGRVKYSHEDPRKQSPTKGSIITYLGPDLERFVSATQNHGYVMVPAGWL